MNEKIFNNKEEKNILIFDTETTNLQKPFVYNIGYIIYSLDKQEKMEEKEFIVQQVWHNPMLFPTSYYLADLINEQGEIIRSSKKSLYIAKMRARQATLDKYGYITQEMIRDIKKYNIKTAYAYNSSFDERVFKYNCDWFKCNNPFDNVEIFDIMTYAQNFICNTQQYQSFCENNIEIIQNDKTKKFFTETLNYKTTAETVYCFLLDTAIYEEEHTALADSQIELEILLNCFARGAEIGKKYPIKYCDRLTQKLLTIKKDNKTILQEPYTKKITKKSNDTIYLR